MASSSSCIYFFFFFSQARNHLLFLDYYVWLCSFQNVIPVDMNNTSRYELLLQWQQNRSKATMWLLYKNCTPYLKIHLPCGTSMSPSLHV
jgi:hypothetical protein